MKRQRLSTWIKDKIQLKETFLDIKTQPTESGKKKGKRYNMKIIMKGGGKRLRNMTNLKYKIRL